MSLSTPSPHGVTSSAQGRLLLPAAASLGPTDRSAFTLSATGTHLSSRCCYTERLLNWESVYIWEQLGYPTWLAFLEGFSQTQKRSLTKDYVHYCRCTSDCLLITTGVSCQKCLTRGLPALQQPPWPCIPTATSFPSPYSKV
uniref:Uncharacterized protein n=1 Tax=Myotis myotis TaxID=51298 RepID=A0A7J8AN74_MYOMY|nr:hypothetical protein mMyoMyo1_008138 [Myotis myotis]